MALAQTSTLIQPEILDALIAETSGEMGLNHFSHIVSNFSGFSPSLGAEQTADYIAENARRWGLSDVKIERFPSDGKLYYWAFRSEPWWEGKKAEIWLVEPQKERIASFDVYRGHLARFSRSANVTAELVDVGVGTKSSDYEGESVAGKIVLASGPAAMVHQRAVWEYGAAGVIAYRTSRHVSYPDLVGSAQIAPREGPNGEPPRFVISISYRSGKTLSDRLAAGEKLVVRADVEAETRAGHYPQVHAVVKGREPELPEVWIQAHTNHRNTGGGNNLTGVGTTLDLARSLATLVEQGKIPRPRRNIRFTWGAEHTASIYYFYTYPENTKRVLAYLNLDMVGDHQHLSQSILRLYRTPHSRPSFINDITQEMFETIAEGNTISIRNGRGGSFSSEFLLPVVDPSGSGDQFFYRIEEFWGPSDHEDVGEASIGIDAVLLNTWPDPFIGTQEDTRARADATQMKRAGVITGAAAFVMASAGPDDIPDLAQNALEKARARLAAEERRAMDLLWTASKESAPDDFWQGTNIITQAYRREAEALARLQVFADQAGSNTYLTESVNDLSEGEPAAQKRLSQQATTLAEIRGWGSIEPSAPPRGGIALLVPSRSMDIRGPVNLFRHQYGQDWLKEKLRDPDFLEKIRLARRGRYYAYETLNFVDGNLNLGQIQERVAAEYGLAPIEEIEEYFRMLEKVGVVTLADPEL
jgi:hypothetical protein